jgi:hypothetical protein
VIRALLSLVPGWLWAGLLLLALVVSYGVGHKHGAERMHARWASAELKRQQAEADQRREDARIARAAEREFEAWRADQARRRVEVARAIKQSLPGPLAAVVVPAAAVDQLRRAGADSDTPGSAASQPGR